MAQSERGLGRRALLRGAALGAVAMACVPVARAGAGGPRLTPTCADDDAPTAPLMEGPYFKTGSPERRNLREGLPGVLLTLFGSVVDTSCRPVADALLEFWQADAEGRYDLDGYTLRGHQYTGADGLWVLETIVPRWYGGVPAGQEAGRVAAPEQGFVRTPHIHAKVQAPDGPVLTTQLYFPAQIQAYGQDVAQMNATDALFDPRLVVQPVGRGGEPYVAQFGFVVSRS